MRCLRIFPKAGGLLMRLIHRGTFPQMWGLLVLVGFWCHVRFGVYIFLGSAAQRNFVAGHLV